MTKIKIVKYAKDQHSLYWTRDPYKEYSYFHRLDRSNPTAPLRYRYAEIDGGVAAANYQIKL